VVIFVFLGSPVTMELTSMSMSLVLQSTTTGKTIPGPGSNDRLYWNLT
jgi:hypothetical protein